MHTTEAGEVTSLPTQSHSKPEAFPMLLVGVGAGEYWRALEKEVCLEEEKLEQRELFSSPGIPL